MADKRVPDTLEPLTIARWQVFAGIAVLIGVVAAIGWAVFVHGPASASPNGGVIATSAMSDEDVTVPDPTATPFVNHRQLVPDCGTANGLAAQWGSRWMGLPCAKKPAAALAAHTPMPQVATTTTTTVAATTYVPRAQAPADPPAAVHQVADTPVHLEAGPNDAAQDAAAQADLARGTASSPGATRMQTTSFVANGAQDVGYEARTSRFELDETSVIPARLASRIDSSLPGLVRADVSQDVYDSATHSVVVIPMGAHLVGSYDSATIAGEARLMVVWTRILFHDGRKFAMGSEPGAGAMGEAGLGADRIETGAGRAFGQALLYTLMNAAGEFIGRATTIDLSSASSAMFTNAQRQRPIIHIDPPMEFNVFVARDLPLERYQEAEK